MQEKMLLLLEISQSSARMLHLEFTILRFFMKNCAVFLNSEKTNEMPDQDDSGKPESKKPKDDHSTTEWSHSRKKTHFGHLLGSS